MCSSHVVMVCYCCWKSHWRRVYDNFECLYKKKSGSLLKAPRTIKRDSISLLRSHFCSHVQLFWCEILSFCRLKYPYSCFSSCFFFLVIVVLFAFILSVLLLAAIISAPLFIFMSSASPNIDLHYTHYTQC